MPRPLNSRPSFIRTFILTSAAALLMSAGGTLAQGGPGGGFGMMFGRGQSGGPMTQETIDRYARMLNLTPDQKDRVKQAYNAYRAEYDTEEAAVQEKVNEARKDAQDSRDPAAMRNAMAPMREFQDAATKMEQGFLGQFKGVLTPEQVANWTKLERAMRRERAANGMMVASGEKTDLVQVVDKLELDKDARAALNPTLDQYEADLDKELAVRAKVNEEVAAKMQELRPQGGGNSGNRNGGGPGGGPGGFQEMIQKMQPVIDKAKNASSKVQDVNRRYAAKIQAQLPEDRRAAFVKAVKESRFPDGFRPSTAGRQLAAAMEMADLEAKQAATVKSLRESYAKKVAEINEKLAAATEKDEAERMAQPGLGFGRGGRGGPGGGNSELGDLRQDKRDLDQDTMDSLAKILNKDQVAKLPKPEVRNFGGFGGPGGGFGGGPGGRGGGDNQGGGGRRGRGGGNGG